MVAAVSVTVMMVVVVVLVAAVAAAMVVETAAGWRNTYTRRVYRRVRESGFGCARGAAPANGKRADRRRAVGRARWLADDGVARQ